MGRYDEIEKKVGYSLMKNIGYDMNYFYNDLF